MDPAKNLDAALEHARLIVAVSEDLDGHPEADNVCVDDTSLSLAQTLLDLNEWISQGFPLPAQWVRPEIGEVAPRGPERLMVGLREWGERHDFHDSEAEDSFDRGIGNIQWALAVESANERDKPDIWHDDEGIWRQIGALTYGPFATEAEAEEFNTEEES